jgi:hypothetical protein
MADDARNVAGAIIARSVCFRAINQLKRDDVALFNVKALL